MHDGVRRVRGERIGDGFTIANVRFDQREAVMVEDVRDVTPFDLGVVKVAEAVKADDAAAVGEQRFDEV